MNKKQLYERHICTMYITLSLEKAGWYVTTQIREEFPLTKGRIIVRDKLMAEHQQIIHQLEAAQAALKAEFMPCLGGKA